MRRAVSTFGAALLVLATLGACTGASSPQDGGAAPTVAAARALLARQAAAIRRHDVAGVRAGLDPSAAASAFRAALVREVRNGAQVPLATWSYQVIGPIHDAPAVRAARARFGAPVLLLHVSVGYELRGVDTVPSHHDQYLVFVARDGTTDLAGDDALAGEGTVSWRPPWHDGPLDVALARTGLVLGPPAERARLPGLAARVDAAVAAVTAVWGDAWSRRVAVIIAASPAQFVRLTGSGVTDVSAAAVTDGIDPVTGRPTGQRLVLNPLQLRELTPTGQGIVLRHEITHLATAAATADITPRWLVEGFAEYVGNLTSGQPVPVAAAELRAAVAAGSTPTRLPSAADFSSSGASLARAYEQSWLACRLIAQRAGRRGLVRFYRAVGTALEPAAPALADAFGHVLHESQQAFTVQWRRYLTGLLR